MARTVVFLRPWNDPLTSYLYSWTQDVVEDAEKNSDDVVNIEGKKAVRKNLASFISKFKPTFIQLNGHGNEGLIIGHDNKPLLDSSNAEITKGTIVYSRSCSTALVLGQMCIKAGAKCYIGYRGKFYMPRDKTKIRKPLEDEIAACTLEPSNQLIRSILKGHSVKEAKARATNVSLEKLNFLLSSDAPDGSYITRFAVLSNLRNQVVLGDSEVSY